MNDPEEVISQARSVTEWTPTRFPRKVRVRYQHRISASGFLLAIGVFACALAIIAQIMHALHTQ